MTLRHGSVATGLIVAYGAAGSVYTFVPYGTGWGQVLAHVVLVLAALGAAGLAAGAVRALPPSAASPWYLMGGAALAAALAEGLRPLSAGSSVARDAGLLASLLSFALLGLALAWTVHQRDIGRLREIFIDAALILIVSATVLFRYSPAARAIASDPFALPVVPTVTTILIPVAAVCALTFAIVLLLARRSSGAEDSAAGILGASALLAISTLPVIWGDALCCPAPLGLVLATVFAWGFLAYAGLSVVRGGAGSFTVAGADPGGAVLRQTVSPIVALVLAMLIVDAALRPPLLEASALAMAVVAVLLALRMSHLLEATRHTSAEKQELKHSRALVEVSRALSGTTQLADTLEVVTDWARRLLDANAAVIELLTPDGEQLELKAAVGLPPEAVGLTFPVEGSFTGWVVRHGEPRVTADPREEPDIRAESRPFLGRSPVIAAPLRYHDRVMGVLACISSRPFGGTDFELLGALADQAALAIENTRLFKQVDTLSKTDPLTGLSNRRQLEVDLAREFAAAQRGRKLIAVMFDVNDFKDYNDKYGHLAGDEVLRLFGDVLKSETRAMNPPARYGGDEFVALLTDTDARGAQLFMERVRLRFSQEVARLRRRTLAVGGGFALFDPEMASPDDLIDAADRSLYESKANKGRTG